MKHLRLGAAIPPTALGVLAVLATFMVNFLHPAWGRDSVQDCATFGPHSVGCRRGIEQRDDPDRIEEDLRRARQEQRNHEPARHIR